MRDYISATFDIVWGEGVTISVMEGIIPKYFDLKHVPVIIKLHLFFIRTIDCN